MTRTTRTPALAALTAAMVFSAASLAPSIAFAQTPAAPEAPAAAAAPAMPAPPASAPAMAAPADATAAPAVPGAPALPGALPTVPGAPEPAALAPGAAPAVPAADAGAAMAPNAAPGAAPGAAPDATRVDLGNGTEEVANPYGLGALWQGSDYITKGVLVMLAIMSLGTWYIVVTKVFEQSRLFSAAKEAAANFWQTSSVRDGAAKLKDSSPFRYIADSGLTATDHHEGTLVEAIDLHTWVSMSLDRSVSVVNSRLQGGLAFLATVGSTAPFIGLFGTVWGILHALTAIGIAGQASIDKVAGPVGEALIMTALGLATAVPAVLGYNWLVRRNKAAIEKVRNFAADLHAVLIKTSGKA